MIAIVAPMKQELSGLIQQMGQQMGGAYQCTFPQKTPQEMKEGAVLVHVTGVGKERALAGVEALFNRSVRPDCIVSLGFAGALRDGLDTGDLVLSRRLYATGEEAFLEPDAHLLGLAQEALKVPQAPRHFIADALTVPHVVYSAAEKGRLAITSTAWVANMEDYWIGKAVTQQGVPFLSVRAVLDTARQELPPFVAELGEKGPLGQILHVAANLLAGPRNVPRVVNLSKQVRVAQASLAAFGLSFVARMKATGSYSLFF